MKYGLSNEQLKEITSSIRKYPEVEKAVLFGSRVIDTYKEASDVDIALMGPNVTAALAAKLKFNIEEDTYLPFFFDFIAYPTITSDELKKHIRDKGVVIYRKGMSEWKECKLGKIYDFASGLSKSRNEFGFGYEFLSFKDVFHNFFIPDNLTQLANTTEQERKRCSIKRGDVFLTRTSETQEELGMSSVALKDYPNATFNGFTKRLRLKDSSLIFPEYAGFYFRSPHFRALVTSMASITTRASLNNGMLSELTIVIPPMKIQKAIASVLSSLDDKIDLLHRQNKTLEDMAETLFRQWFVKNKNSKLIFFGELLDTVSIKHNFSNDKVIFLNTSDVYDGKVLHHEYSAIVGLPGQAKKSIQKDDILFTEIRPANRRFAYIDFNAEDYVVSTKLMVLRSKKVVDTSILYLFLKRQETLDYLQMLAEARSGTFPQITFDHLKTVEIYIPEDEKILKIITSVLQNIVQKTFKNHSQVHSLEKLRDTLLPKLMSGEVKVTV